MQDDFNLWNAFKAVFLPTGSAVHVAGFQKPVADFFFWAEVIELQVSVEGFNNLCNFIGENIKKDCVNHAIPLGEGLYGESLFYEGNSKYYFPKTSNVWTAQALKHAELPVSPYSNQTSGHLMSRLRKLGKVVNKPEKD